MMQTIAVVIILIIAIVLTIRHTKAIFSGRRQCHGCPNSCRCSHHGQPTDCDECSHHNN